MTRIFSFSLNRDSSCIDVAASYLDDSERDRAGKFRLSMHRHRFIVRRAFLRILLAEQLQVTPGEIRFDEGEFGEPFVVGAPDDLSFSASHSLDLGVIAIAGSRVGIDIESLDRDIDHVRFADKSFSPEEISEISTCSDDARSQVFFNCWTGKEAYLKALGLGLPGGLRSFAVRCAPDDTPGLLWSKYEEGSMASWTFRRYNRDRFVVTVAVNERDAGQQPELKSLSTRSIDAGRPIVANEPRSWHER